MNPDDKSGNYRQPNPESSQPSWQSDLTDQPTAVAFDGAEQPPAQPQVPIVTLNDATGLPGASALPDEMSDDMVGDEPPDQGVAVKANKAVNLDEQPIQWDATEYIQHDKDALWFVVFAVIVLGLVAVAILLINSWSFAAVLAVMAGAVIAYDRRPPRILRYTLSNQGIHVGEKLYSFAEFKAFGIVHDGDAFFVMLVPNKRFMPAVSIYFPEEVGEQIVDALGSRLPMQDLHLDAIDVVVRKLRL